MPEALLSVGGRLSDGSAPVGSRYFTGRDGVQAPPWRMHDPEDRIFRHLQGERRGTELVDNGTYQKLAPISGSPVRHYVASVFAAATGEGVAAVESWCCCEEPPKPPARRAPINGLATRIVSRAAAPAPPANLA